MKGGSSGSGCCCSSKATPTPAVVKTGCCGGTVDVSEGGHGEHHYDRDHADHDDGESASVLDPVCGMTVDPATSKQRFNYRNATYHFCSAGCRTKFAAAPEQYPGKSKTGPKSNVPEGTVYT
ncbi:hypothetical protein CEE97_11425, partial [Lactobacillus crispatus]